MNTSMTRRCFLGAMGFAASTALSACKRDDIEGPFSSAMGNVYWLNFKPELDKTLQELASTYYLKTNVPVKIVTAGSGSYERTLAGEMILREPPTLFNLGNADDAKEWGQHALDLAGTAIADECIGDDYNMYDAYGRLISIGYCSECYGIVANTDLLKQAGHSVEEIKNFDSLKAVAEDIHSRARELGFDAFVAADLDAASSWRVSGHLANLVYYYEEQDEGPFSDRTATIKGTYLPNYKKLYDLIISNSLVEPEALAEGGHDPAGEFKNGEACFFLTGSWDYADLSASQPNITMLPYYCGVEGEEKAGLNSGTESGWALNADVDEDDQQATIDFMVWMVTDAEASATLVEQLGYMPFRNAAKSNNGFQNDAARYIDEGCYVMDWATNYQPNVDDYRAGVVKALKAYNIDRSDASWEAVRSAFVDGWSDQYKVAHG